MKNYQVKGKIKKMVNMFERSKLKLTLCETLKNDYVALLGQRGIGTSTLVKELLQAESPLRSMQFALTPLPKGVDNYQEFMEIYLNNLLNLCSQLCASIPTNIETLSVNQKLREIINHLGRNIKSEYLVIVLQDLADCKQELLKQFLLIIREYYDQINVRYQGGEKIRFLVVGGLTLWKLCCNRDVDDQSPFNIVKLIYLGGLSSRDISNYVPNLSIKQQAEALNLSNGIPSLVKLMCEAIDEEDISQYFSPLSTAWDGLSNPAKDTLFDILENQKDFPNCRIDFKCPEIPVFTVNSPLEEAFWGGFIRIRYNKITWRSPLHQAFIQNQIKQDFLPPKSQLITSYVHERFAQLEKMTDKPLSGFVLKQFAEELMSIAPHKDQEKMLDILEMICDGQQNTMILETIRTNSLLNLQENISGSNFKEDLCKLIYNTMVNTNSNSSVVIANSVINSTELDHTRRTELREIILQYFSEDELEMLLSEKLSLDYKTIKKGDNYKIIVFNLIKDLESRNETQVFVKALAEDRPKVPALQNFYHQNYQNPLIH
jgi:energy-coupling factor transporter ATP-binding protein EcfA2